MGWNFRRGLNFGPLRINASKSGIGYSVGVSGFRIGQDAKGRKYTAASIPGTGIYRRDYLQHAAPQNQRANVPASPVPQVPAARRTTIPARRSIRLFAVIAYVGAALLIYLVIRALS
jgi:hypothetical protein